MMNIASGALLGEKIPTLIYINSLFGFFLTFVYHVTTALNWYVLFVLIVPLFISTTLFVRLFFYALKRHQWLAFGLLGIFIFFFFKNLIFLFTRSAYLLILSSALALMLAALKKEPLNPKTLYWVGFLMGYAFLIRPMAALSGFVIFDSYLSQFAVFNLTWGWRKNRHSLPPYLLYGDCLERTHHVGSCVGHLSRAQQSKK